MIFRALSGFWLSKLIVHERAGEPLRKVFRATALDTEASRYFINCTRCVGFWTVLLSCFLPTRLVRFLATVALNDLLHVCFRCACSFNNRCERETDA
jgi:hypothetical protein